MSDAQLLSGFNRLEKILKETEVYNKAMSLFKEGIPPSSLFDDDEDLLFPLEIGSEFYQRALKVYQDSKNVYDSIEKQLNKCIDKINKNEKVSGLALASKYQSSSNNTNSSSSSEDDEDKKEVGQKRKSKTNNPALSTKTKRFKAQPQSESDRSEKESREASGNGTATGPQINNPSPVPKEIGANGASSKDPIPVGTLVAAREKSNQWILAKVNSYNAKTQKYEVIDEDEEEQKKFSVLQKDCIQLPGNGNMPVFSVGTKVLAMFPDTTTFYTAVVSQVSKTKNKLSHYVLHFDDDLDSAGQTPNRRVNPQHVIANPK